MRAARYADGSQSSFQHDMHWRASLLPMYNKQKIPLLLQVNKKKDNHLKRPAPSRVFTGSLLRTIWHTYILSGSEKL